MPAGHARYSAWTGQGDGAGPGAEQVLGALADAVLTEGVDSALGKMIHQGIDTADEVHLPGLDDVRSQLRAQLIDAVEELLDQLDPQDLAACANAASDDHVRRMLNALRARSPVFPALLKDASAVQREDLEGALQSSAPGAETLELSDHLDRMIELTDLERQVRSVRDVGDLEGIDLDSIRKLLGDLTAESFGSLVEAAQAFTTSGYVEASGNRSTLSARAVQLIGDTLLLSSIQGIQSRSAGQHERRDLMQRNEPAGTSRDYKFGDPFELDLGRSLLEAVKRNPGAPVRFSVDDLKVIERESSERATTVLAIDLSRSMGERGFLLAAKKLALALSTYIRRRYPHDELVLIGFSESARVIQLQELVDLTWDRYGYGTNVHDALRVANNILSAHRGRKRNVVLITDGEPTAHRSPDGKVIFNHPPAPETVALTFREADRLRREGVYLCVCLLSASESVGNFGRELARHAGGEVMRTDPDSLSALLVERYSNRRR